MTFPLWFPRLRAAMQTALLHRSAKTVLCLLLLGPLAYWAWLTYTQQLGFNPAETLIRATGDWALRLLLLTLAVRPLRVWLGLPALLRLRRTVGLMCFLYAFIHALCYVVLDQGADWQLVAADILQRPFIWVGFLAFLLLCALAATSSNWAIRKLGAAQWQRLHRLVYAAGILGILHFLWVRSGKQLFGEVVIYGTLLALLLIWRVRQFMLRRQFSWRQTARLALQNLLR